MIRIRPFEPADAPELLLVFQRSVQEGAASAYDAAQRHAWASAVTASPVWTRRLGDQITVVAQHPDGLIGFMTLGYDGHLDLAYVRPDWMGKGIAARLHDRLLARAEDHNMTRLTTEASLLARRFFLRQGWRELARQEVQRGAVSLTNFRMDKRLAGQITPSTTSEQPAPLRKF
ncbi:GNAT family N-acetyltransferase [Pseudoruegeria sp. SK021]|uniref:GNAT family N-acetyltransferase n=1 Tax=Pseudoruegeria sp. SK021 TaxID=1933035 RepID=UPI000A24174A|nr:GNAT family N-acetyltransferase [Pseudoruegeria sp. SK021]OSP55482.1 hypothetical protein BV911_07500 [Pseudoruegeria sp. SK021]